MTLKSTIDVDVNDAQFARFKELFDQYTAALAKTPKVWANISKEQQLIAEHFEKQTAALMAQRQLAHENEERDKQQHTHLTRTEKLWQSMSKHSDTMLRNVLGISRNTMGWVQGLGVVGLAAAVGYEAFHHVNEAATTVSGQRREARGLGISIGTMEAFKTAFGRDVDPSFMHGMLDIETDPSKVKAWGALGLGQMSGDVGKDMVALLNAERNFAKSQPLASLGKMAEAYGLPSSIEELMNLRGTDDKEWQEQTQKFLTIQKSANITDKDAGVAQKFQTQMEAASKAIAAAWHQDMIKVMPIVGNWVEKLGPSIANYLTHPLNAAGQAIDIEKQEREKARDAAMGKGAALVEKASEYAARGAQWVGSKFSDLLSSAAQTYGVSTELLAAQMMAESGGNPNAVSPKGAQGLGQFMPKTARDMGITNPFDPGQSISGMGKYDSQLLAHYGGDQREALAAYNYGMGNVDKLIKRYGNDWFAHAPKETQGYVNKIMVQINNNTGGSATASVSALAAPSG